MKPIYKPIEYVFNRKLLRGLEKEYKKPRVLLFLTPQYVNCGDHAIAWAELQHLKKVFFDRTVLDVNYSAYNYFRNRIKAAIKPEDIIIITGGGYLGNVWEENELLAEDIMRSFASNRIILAPQTIFFEKCAQGGNRESELAHLMKRCDNLFIYAREEHTGEWLKRKGFVRGENYEIVPDYALFLEIISFSKVSEAGCALCLRDDKEKRINTDEVRRWAQKHLGSVDELSMFYPHKEIPVSRRGVLLQKKINEFATKRIVITDRLHAMIFAAHTGTPCVVFDNTSKKISGVYEWINNLRYIKIISGTALLDEAFNEVIGYSDKEKNRKLFLKRQARLKKNYLPILEEEYRRTCLPQQ